MKGHIRATLAAAIVAAFLSMGAGSALAWNPAVAVSFDTLQLGGSRLVTTLTGGTTLDSSADFTAALGAGAADPVSVTSAPFTLGNGISSTGLFPRITAQGLPWAGFGTGTGATGTVTISPTFLSQMYSDAARTRFVCDLTVRGDVTGAYTSNGSPQGRATLRFAAAGDTIRVIAANGAPCTGLVGAAGDLTGTVVKTTAGAGPLLQ
jgi:hypothetical protein